jgi:cation diffusion facilitator family transporter
MHAQIDAGGTNHAERERAVFLSLIIDVVLWIPDIIAALMSGSVTMMADVLKCANEIFATFLAWLTLRKVSRGNHAYDYGLGKLENLTSAIVGLAMLISLYLVFSTAISRLIAPEILNSGGVWVGIFFMTLGVVTNSGLWIKNYRVAQKEHSPIMESQWRLFRTKAFSDGTVLFSLLAGIIFESYSWSIYIDPLASFIISGFLLLSGYKVLMTSFPDLLDRTLEESLQIVITRELAEFFDDYKALHGVRSRRSGSMVYIEILLEFDSNKHMGEVHATATKIQASLESKIRNSSVSIVLSTGKKEVNQVRSVNDKTEVQTQE